MWLLLAAAYFVVTIGLHALVTRLPLGVSSVARFVVVGCLCGLVLAAHLFALYGLTPPVVTALLLFALASEVYIFLFTLTMSSISSTILLTLRSGAIDEQALDARYSASYMVDSRLTKLEASDFLHRDGDRFSLTTRGQGLVASFRRVRRLFFRAARDAE